MADIIIIAVILYAAVGVFFVASTRSRGVLADVLFGVFWLAYVISDWRNGRL